VDQDVYANSHGALSKHQQRFLVYRFLERIILASIPCYIAFFQLLKFADVLTSMLGWIIGLLGIGSTVILIWNYGYDLFFSQPRSITGNLHKYRSLKPPAPASPVRVLPRFSSPSRPACQPARSDHVAGLISQALSPAPPALACWLNPPLSPSPSNEAWRCQARINCRTETIRQSGTVQVALVMAHANSRGWLLQSRAPIEPLRDPHQSYEANRRNRNSPHGRKYIPLPAGLR